MFNFSFRICFLICLGEFLIYIFNISYYFYFKYFSIQNKSKFLNNWIYKRYYKNYKKNLFSEQLVADFKYKSTSSLFATYLNIESKIKKDFTLVCDYQYPFDLYLYNFLKKLIIFDILNVNIFKLKCITFSEFFNKADFYFYCIKNTIGYFFKFKKNKVDEKLLIKLIKIFGYNNLKTLKDSTIELLIIILSNYTIKWDLKIYLIIFIMKWRIETFSYIESVYLNQYFLYYKRDKSKYLNHVLMLDIYFNKLDKLTNINKNTPYYKNRGFFYTNLDSFNVVIKDEYNLMYRFFYFLPLFVYNSLVFTYILYKLKYIFYRKIKKLTN